MQALIILGCLAVAQCAPAEVPLAPAEPPLVPAEPSVSTAGKEEIQQDNANKLPPLREYLILTPEAQLQLQPALKLQQSMIQPLALYGSAPTPSKRQYDAICNQIQTGVGGISEIFLGNFPFLEIGNQGDGGSESRAELAKQQQEGLNANPQALPQTIVPKLATAEFPIAAEHRFYTIAGRPQFFSNVDVLQNPLQPIFSIQPLQAVKARNVPVDVDSVDTSPQEKGQRQLLAPLLEQQQNNEEIAPEQLQQENLGQLIKDEPILLQENPSGKSVDIVEPKELAAAESSNFAELPAEQLNVNLEQKQDQLIQNEGANAENVVAEK